MTIFFDLFDEKYGYLITKMISTEDFIKIFMDNFKWYVDEIRIILISVGVDIAL